MYSLKKRWFRLIALTDSWWYGVVNLWSTFKILNNSVIISDYGILSRSRIEFLSADRKSLTMALAIVFADLSGTGLVIKYFVRSQTSVTADSLQLCDFGNLLFRCCWACLRCWYPWWKACRSFDDSKFVAVAIPACDVDLPAPIESRSHVLGCMITPVLIRRARNMKNFTMSVLFADDDVTALSSSYYTPFLLRCFFSRRIVSTHIARLLQLLVFLMKYFVHY